MQKTVVKSLGIFMLVFFVLSMTGAAAICKAPYCKMDARNDVYTLNPCKVTKCFNVLSNDLGAGRKVTTIGKIATTQGGEVTMKSNGVFCYTKPVACSKLSDSFTYTAINKYKQTDNAKVTLKFTCAGCTKCPSGKCKCASCSKCASNACTSCTSSSCSSCA